MLREEGARLRLVEFSSTLVNNRVGRFCGVRPIASAHHHTKIHKCVVCCGTQGLGDFIETLGVGSLNNKKQQTASQPGVLLTNLNNLFYSCLSVSPKKMRVISAFDAGECVSPFTTSRKFSNGLSSNLHGDRASNFEKSTKTLPVDDQHAHRTAELTNQQPALLMKDEGN